MIEFRFFGQFSITADGKPIDIPSRPTQSLLANLVLNAGKSYRREQLAGMVWPDASEKNGRAYLRQSLWRIRKSLGEDPQTGLDYLITDKISVQFNADTQYWLDTSFLGRDPSSSKTADKMISDLSQLEGEFLPGFYDDWVQVEREQLRVRHERAIHILLEQLAMEGRWQDVIDWSERWIALGSVPEPAFRFLMWAYGELGETAGIVSVFERCRNALMEQLGVIPSEETRQTYDWLLQEKKTKPPQWVQNIRQKHHPEEKFSATDIGETKPTFASSPSTPLKVTTRRTMIGREREMAQAQRLWEGTRSGTGGTLLVMGEPGIGKTRFIRECDGMVAQSGGQVLTGACYLEGNLPYGGITQAILDAFQRTSWEALNLPDFILADLIALAPSLRMEYPAIPPNQSLDSLADQHRLYENVVLFFHKICSQSPLMVVIDDLHWADGGTLSLLRHLIRRSKNRPIMIIITSRQDTIDQSPEFQNFFQDLLRERVTKILELQSLDKVSTKTFLEDWFGRDIPTEFLDVIYHQTEGNPFFIEEVCKSLEERGDFVFPDGISEGINLDELDVPQTVKLVIQSRLEHLPDLSREALYAAAILGRDFDFETLLLVSKVEEGALINALDDSERAQIIHELSSQSGGTFSFVHALIPATILEDMSNLRRRHLHLQAAQAIQAHSPERVDSLAYHFYEAGDPEGARDFFIQAGDQAQEILALDVAISNYRKALEGFTEDMTAGRINILQKIAYGLLVIGRQDDALTYLSQALALCAETGDIQQAGVTERLIARVHWELGDRPEALNHYHQSLAHLESLGDSKELARTVSTISQMHMLASEYPQAIEWGERALELADRFDAEDVTVHALNNLGVSIIATNPQEHDKGISFLEESLHRSLILKLPHDALRAYHNLSEYYLGLGYYDQLENLFPEAIHYATETNAAWFRDNHFAQRSVFYWRTGRWKEALIFKDQITVEDSDYSGNLIEIDIDLGRQQTALERLERFSEFAFQRNELQTLIPYLGLTALAHIGLNQPQEASQSYQMILDRLQKSPYVHRDCPSPLRDGCKYFAFEIQSIDKANEFLDLLSRCHNQLNTPEANYSFYEGQGVVHHASGELPLAADHYKKALKGWESLGWPMNQIRTLYQLSKTQKDLKHLSEAHVSLVQATELIAILENQIEDQNLRKSFRKTNIVVNIFESKNVIERALGM